MLPSGIVIVSTVCSLDQIDGGFDLFGLVEHAALGCLGVRKVAGLLGVARQSSAGR